MSSKDLLKRFLHLPCIVETSAGQVVGVLIGIDSFANLAVGTLQHDVLIIKDYFAIKTARLST
jgi:small nuclear ribonucleoprotein (snRNP)-like protein